MVNNTANNYPAPEQQKEHQPACTTNHVKLKLHDTDAMKGKLKTLFDHNYQYYFERELNDCVTPDKQTKRLR